MVAKIDFEKKRETDFAEHTQRISYKTMASVILFVMSVTSMLVMGWTSIKSDAAQIQGGVSGISADVKILICLAQQQQDYEVSHIKPSRPCQ